jgi:hypothetical protein
MSKEEKVSSTYLIIIDEEKKRKIEKGINNQK